MIIVSACLAYVRCRYDGTGKPCEAVIRLVAEGKALPVCPEQLGDCLRQDYLLKSSPIRLSGKMVWM
jgi:hypothetical protein